MSRGGLVIEIRFFCRDIVNLRDTRRPINSVIAITPAIEVIDTELLLVALLHLVVGAGIGALGTVILVPRIHRLLALLGGLLNVIAAEKRILISVVVVLYDHVVLHLHHLLYVIFGSLQHASRGRHNALRRNNLYLLVQITRPIDIVETVDLPLAKVTHIKRLETLVTGETLAYGPEGPLVYPLKARDAQCIQLPIGFQKLPE